MKPVSDYGNHCFGIFSKIISVMYCSKESAFNTTDHDFMTVYKYKVKCYTFNVHFNNLTAHTQLVKFSLMGFKGIIFWVVWVVLTY